MFFKSSNINGTAHKKNKGQVVGGKFGGGAGIGGQTSANLAFSSHETLPVIFEEDELSIQQPLPSQLTSSKKIRRSRSSILINRKCGRIEYGELKEQEHWRRSSRQSRSTPAPPPIPLLQNGLTRRQSNLGAVEDSFILRFSDSTFCFPHPPAPTLPASRTPSPTRSSSPPSFLDPFSDSECCSNEDTSPPSTPPPSSLSLPPVMPLAINKLAHAIPQIPPLSLDNDSLESLFCPLSTTLVPPASPGALGRSVHPLLPPSPLLSDECSTSDTTTSTEYDDDDGDDNDNQEDDQEEPSDSEWYYHQFSDILTLSRRASTEDFCSHKSRPDSVCFPSLSMSPTTPVDFYLVNRSRNGSPIDSSSPFPFPPRQRKKSFRIPSHHPPSLTPSSSPLALGRTGARTTSAHHFNCGEMETSRPRLPSVEDKASVGFQTLSTSIAHPTFISSPPKQRHQKVGANQTSRPYLNLILPIGEDLHLNKRGSPSDVNMPSSCRRRPSIHPFSVGRN